MTDNKVNVLGDNENSLNRLKSYTTDNRVVHKAKDEDIIQKIGKF